MQKQHMLPSSTDPSLSFADWVGFIFLQPANQNWQLQLYPLARIQSMIPLTMTAGFFFPSLLLSTAADLDSSLQWSLEMSHFPVGTQGTTPLPAALEEIPPVTAQAPQKPVDPVSHYLNTGSFAAEGSFQLALLHLPEAH